MLYFIKDSAGKVHSLPFKNYWDARRDCKAGETVVERPLHPKN